MSNLEIKRDHEGKMHLFVAGHPALGAKVVGMQVAGDFGMCATVLVPIADVTFGEVGTVIPMLGRRLTK